MTEQTEGALDGPSTEAVSPEAGASEATEITEGAPEGATAEAELDAEKAKADAEETERKSRNERRREAKERLQQAAHEAEQRALAAEQQAKRMRDALASRPLPKLEDFNGNYDAYQAELAARRTLGILRAEQADELAGQAKAERDRIAAARQATQQADAQHWASQVQEAKARYTDFDQVALRDAPIDARMAEVIVQSDAAADLAYWLGKHPDEAKRIGALPDRAMALALGRIEERLAAPPPPPVTSAPAPINPVRGKATATVDPARMSAAEYAAKRAAGWTPAQG